MLRKLSVTVGIVTILGVAAYFAPQETDQVARASLAPVHIAAPV